MLPIGEAVPDFSAELDDGTIFRLADSHGEKHVVIYFYPKDFTRG